MLKRIFHISMSFVIYFAVASLTPYSSFLALAQTYDAEAAKERSRGKRRTPALSEKIYKYLGEAQQFADRGDYNTALDVIEPLGKMKLNAYEEAQYWNFSAYLFYAQENYPAAIEAYEMVLKLPNLPIAMEDTTVYTLAQLNFIAKNSQQSIDYMYRWLKYQKIPSAQPFILLALAYHDLENFDRALHHMLIAKDKYAEAKKPMKHKHYKLLASLYLELDQKYNILKLQQDMLRDYPSSEGWTMLAKICTKLIAEHDDQSPLSVAELQTIQSDALNKAEDVTIHRRDNYNGAEHPIEYMSPIYPREALIAGKSGEVTLFYDVSEDGFVTNIRVNASTDHIFDQAAIKALESYKFNPDNFQEKLSTGKAVIVMPEEKKPDSPLTNPLKLDQYPTKALPLRKNIMRVFKFDSDIWAKVDKDAKTSLTDAVNK